MDFLSGPNLRRGDHRLALRDKGKGDRQVGVIAMAVADEERIALVDETVHDLFGETEPLNPRGIPTYQIERQRHSLCPNDEPHVVKFPKDRPLLDRGGFDLA